MMLDKNEIKRAVSIHQRTYRLLNWLNSAMDKSFISPKSAHEYASASDAAKSWIIEHFYNLPVDSRPDSLNDREISEFANMFSTYLLTSFDLDEHPPHILKSYDGCYCSYCSYLAAASHLRTKKLTKKDKKRAKKLKIFFVKNLALNIGKSLDDLKTEEIVENPELKENVSMAAYGEQLILRMKGHVEGPAILALWREFAWQSTGSPKKKFQLNASQILKSEEKIVKVLLSSNRY